MFRHSKPAKAASLTAFSLETAALSCAPAAARIDRIVRTARADLPINLLVLIPDSFRRPQSGRSSKIFPGFNIK
jgi:hypothetical protein